MERHLINLLHSSLVVKQFKQAHAQIIKNYPILTPLFIKKLLNSSLTRYARLVFDKMSHPDNILYSSMISAYSKHSMNEEAVGMFVSMHGGDVRIDCFSVPPFLKCCSALLDVGLGKQVHSLVLRYGFDSSVFAQTALLDFYAKSGELDSAKRVFDGILVKDPICYNCLISGYSKAGDVLRARKVFDEMGARSIVSWNSMISCYAHNGDCHEGLRIFERMQAENCSPNEFTVVTVLSICAKLGDLKMGLEVKKAIEDKKLHKNMIVSTALLDMYVKCGAVDEARLEFDSMVRKDVVAWSAMITGYAQNARPTEALELFEQMNRAQIKPNDITLVSVLSACAQLGSVDLGERIGNYVEKHGSVSNVYVVSTLLDMYSKCGNIEKARLLFDRMPRKDIVTWNSMIRGLAFNGFAKDAIALYRKLVKSSEKPDIVTFVCLLTACTHAGLVEIGLDLFEEMRTEHGITPKVEHYACIVDLLCKAGRVKDAYELICKMEMDPNSVIWGTLLSASRSQSNQELVDLSVNKLFELEPENSANYVQLAHMRASEGRWQEALEVRREMKDKSVQKLAAYSWIDVEDQVHKFLVDDTSHPKTDEVYNVVNKLGMHPIGDPQDLGVEAELTWSEVP